jgi:hypothetical protein
MVAMKHTRQLNTPGCRGLAFASQWGSIKHLHHSSRFVFFPPRMHQIRVKINTWTAAKKKKNDFWFRFSTGRLVTVLDELRNSEDFHWQAIDRSQGLTPISSAPSSTLSAPLQKAYGRRDSAFRALTEDLSRIRRPIFAEKLHVAGRCQ